MAGVDFGCVHGAYRMGQLQANQFMDTYPELFVVAGSTWVLPLFLIIGIVVLLQIIVLMAVYRKKPTNTVEEKPNTRINSETDNGFK